MNFEKLKIENKDDKPKPTTKLLEQDKQTILENKKISKETPDNSKKIGEIRQQIQTAIPFSSISPILSDQKTEKEPPETVTINGETYYVIYVSKKDLYPAYGYAIGNKAIVREDLPNRVKTFVKAHELYHCQDKSQFGGRLGQEIRANIIPGLKDPLGLAATAWKSLTDIDRIRFYIERIIKGY